jgi:mannose-6-phosphate isomerase-like protein (cupin superfamily)
MDGQIQIVKRDTIPPLHEVEVGGEVHRLGELRDLRWSEELRRFMPDASVASISWAVLGHGEVLETHVHPIQSMMVIYAGSGELIGDLRCTLRAGDVVIVPAGCKHGFIGGPDSLHALSIQFGEGLYTDPEKARVQFVSPEAQRGLEALTAYNRQRMEEFSKRQIFELLADGTLEESSKRDAYFRYLQIWVNGNQKLLFSRQASCANPRYAGMFLKHMREEMGHDLLHTERTDAEPASPEAAPPKAKDAVLEAITDWFVYQMFLLDDAGKTALIHLVIENASELYHRRAMPVLGKYVKNDYFELHVGADGDHAAMGMALLQNESAKTYARLQHLVGEAWDMIGAMTDRVVELTRSA